MTADEICQKYGYVDKTDFFVSHGVKVKDRNENTM